METFSNIDKIKYGPFQFWKNHPELKSDLKEPCDMNMKCLDTEYLRSNPEDFKVFVKFLKDISK